LRGDRRRPYLGLSILQEFAMRLRLAVLLILAATGALAEGRPSTTAMTCAQARALVTRSGAIVLSTGPNLYDRYVASEIACPTGLYGRPAFVPTRDNPQCNIGLYCTAMTPFPWR
jgi:hypothetical protein